MVTLKDSSPANKFEVYQSDGRSPTTCSGNICRTRTVPDFQVSPIPSHEQHPSPSI